MTSFGNETTADIFHGANTKAARRIPKNLWFVYRRKLDYVDAATNPEDLEAAPSNRLEHLKGNLKGFYSIRVNDQCRIIFKFEGGNASEVTIEDCH